MGIVWSQLSKVLKPVRWAGSVPFPPVSVQRQVVCLLLRPVFMCSSPGIGSRVTRLTGWKCARAPLCFVLFCGCNDCVTVILVWLLHHEWTFHLVGLLRPSAY